MYMETHRSPLGDGHGLEVVIRYQIPTDLMEVDTKYRVSILAPWHDTKKTVYFGVYTADGPYATTRSLAEKVVREYLEKLNELSMDDGA